MRLAISGIATDARQPSSSAALPGSAPFQAMSAERMASLLAAPQPGPSLETLQREGRERRRHFGEQVWAAADYAARQFQPGG